MIARIWRGVARAELADAYGDYIHRTGVAGYLETPGNRGASILRRDVEGGVEFTTLSFWDSMDAVRAFAGDSPEIARYYPEDDAYLIERQSFVEHFEVPFAHLDVSTPGG